MPTLFTRIIEGELPGRFVWQDDDCVAFLTINPLTPGHTLVVPRREVDQWIDLDDDLVAHLHVVAARIGRAIMDEWRPARVAEIVAGFEVPHCHVHVLAADEMADLDFAGADPDPGDEALDEAAERIRRALRAAGHTGQVANGRQGGQG